MKLLRQLCVGFVLLLALSIPTLAGDLPLGVTGEIQNGLTGNIECPGIAGQIECGGITGDILSLLLSLFA